MLIMFKTTLWMKLMSFLNYEQINDIKQKLVDDPIALGRLYMAKKSNYQTLSVDFSLVADYLNEGWEEDKRFKTKMKLKKIKTHSKQFEDDMWCQFYELGYRTLNRDETFELPFGKDTKDKKQIDVIAINEDTACIVECKSSEKPKKAPSYKDEFDLLKLRLDGFKKSISQVYGKNIKIKYIFATRNLRLDSTSDDSERLKNAQAFYYNDNTYSYINSLIKNYKNAAHYQFLGLIFKNEKINNNKIEIPAVEGKMGNKKYYMFSIEPNLLLKMGFILHRTKANDNEMPTYQRLLIPNRLNGITKFIDEGGYFPNSLIINFNSNKNILFESLSRNLDSSSRIGTLKIPNEYAIAYIIDGQHRLYGYANSTYKDNNTVPVVAMNALEPVEQLSIFMDINQNQKAVSPNLRLVLEEDLFWDSDRADSRLKALRSSIIKQLSVADGPLYNKISIGEDSAILSFKPFNSALSKSGLLPVAKNNKYLEESTKAALYNTLNTNNNQEMDNSKKKIVELINLCYGFVEDSYFNVFEKENYFILSNRGTYPFIMLIGSLNTYLVDNGEIDRTSTSKDRFLCMKKYLKVLLEKLNIISNKEAERYLMIQGAGAETAWLKFFQLIVNESFPEYEPSALIEWKERQDKKLQDMGRKYVEDIEKYIKSTVLHTIKTLYANDWELEINTIKRACLDRAEAEKEKHYKEGMKATNTHWTEMFTINDYKTIITKYWTKAPSSNTNFQTFEKLFSIDIGQEYNSKSDKTKWLSNFNSYRNTLAHSGTKETGLNKEEVDLLQTIHGHLIKHRI